MRTIVQRLLRRTGLGGDVARLAALAALALLVGVCANALTPAGLPLWPGTGQRVAVPAAVWRQIRFVEADKIHLGPDALLVDVRDPRDYVAGHPAGAVNLPYRQFSALFPNFKTSVKPGTRVILYCYGHECDTSVRVANRLMQNGFANVLIVQGGFEAWKDRELRAAERGASGG